MHETEALPSGWRRASEPALPQNHQSHEEWLSTPAMNPRLTISQRALVHEKCPGLGKNVEPRGVFSFLHSLSSVLSSEATLNAIRFTVFEQTLGREEGFGTLPGAPFLESFADAAVEQLLRKAPCPVLPFL